MVDVYFMKTYNIKIGLQQQIMTQTQNWILKVRGAQCYFFKFERVHRTNQIYCNLLKTFQVTPLVVSQLVLV